jgi:hypothetical protein
MVNRARAKDAAEVLFQGWREKARKAPSRGSAGDPYVGHPAGPIFRSWGP